MFPSLSVCMLKFDVKFLGTLFLKRKKDSTGLWFDKGLLLCFEPSTHVPRPHFSIIYPSPSVEGKRFYEVPQRHLYLRKYQKLSIDGSVHGA